MIPVASFFQRLGLSSIGNIIVILRDHSLFMPQAGTEEKYLFG